MEEAPWICSEVLLILPHRSGRAWSTHQHRHHLVDSCKSRGSSTATSTHPALSTPLVVGSALHRWERPEAVGDTGQGAQVAAGCATQSWWLQPTAMGFARARETAVQALLGTTKPSVFQNSSSRKKALIQQSVCKACGALPAPGAGLPRPAAAAGRARCAGSPGWDRRLPAADAGPCGKGPNHHARFHPCFFIKQVFSQYSAGAKHLRHKGSGRRGRVCNFPPCFGTEFCSWLKFFSFHNTSGHLS